VGFVVGQVVESWRLTQRAARPIGTRMWPIVVPCDALAVETLPRINAEVTVVERLQRHRCPPRSWPRLRKQDKQLFSALDVLWRLLSVAASDRAADAPCRARRPGYASCRAEIRCRSGRMRCCAGLRRICRNRTCRVGRWTVRGRSQVR